MSLINVHCFKYALLKKENVIGLARLYALTDEEMIQLLEQPEEERYDYMSYELENTLFNTPRACELDKAWDGIQYCLGEGIWSEENRLPYNIIVGGGPLTYIGDDPEELITWKSDEEVVKIAEYLKRHDLSEIIRNNHSKIDAEYYYRSVDDEDLKYLLEWCGNIRVFYENAAQEGYHVIFSVDAL